MNIKAYCKVNLYLDVVGKRLDGFHDILTLFQTVPLYDEINIEFSDEESFKCDPKTDFSWDKNIMKKSIEIFKKLTGYYKFNLAIDMKKKIPMGGGLGGGSADGAAVLKFLGENYKVSDNDLIEIAAHAGSDVPFLIKGGTAIGEGKGEKLTFLDPLELKYEFSFPGVKAETPLMYANIDRYWNELKRSGNPLKLYEALKNKEYRTAGENAFNLFEQVVFNAFPEVENAKKEMMKKERIFTLMSGSGSTIFNVVK